MKSNGYKGNFEEQKIILTFSLYVTDAAPFADGLNLLASDFSHRFIKTYDEVEASVVPPVKRSKFDNKDADAINFAMSVDAAVWRDRGYQWFEKPTADVFSELVKERYIGVRFPSELITKQNDPNSQSYLFQKQILIDGQKESC